MSDANKNIDDVSTQRDTEEKDKMDEIVFLYDDDEKNPNYKTGDDEEEKADHKKMSVWKKIGIAFGCVAGAALVAYLGFAAFFYSHFYFNTEINGNDFSWQSVENVEAFMREQVGGYKLTMYGNDDTTETLVGSDIALEYSPGTTVQDAVKAQNPFLWPKAFFEKEQLEIPIGVEYDKAALNNKIANMNCVTNKKPKKSVSAKPEFNGKEYEIKKEFIGNEVDVEAFTAAIEERLNGFITEMDMGENHCYKEPKYFADAPEVSAARDKMNKYVAASITYDFKPYTETVDKEVISKWISVDKDMKVVLQKKEVEAFVAELAGKYDTSGKPRTFRTANGKTVQVHNGIYGWKIDRNKEYKALLANIEAGEKVTREPAYARRAISHQGNDFGNTYAEVDLSAQHMWFIKNGSIVLSSPIVTGNPNKGNATPQGTYTLSYKTTNAVLRGPLRPDGTREWESPVDYWMPFNGGIGFHDASWQSEFGGSRYQTHGSHGCVNMPHEQARQLYSYIQSGTPVICHY